MRGHVHGLRAGLTFHFTQITTRRFREELELNGLVEPALEYLYPPNHPNNGSVLFMDCSRRGMNS
jgi:hypothetical protein